MNKYPEGPLLLFDGHCNLCNGAVQWVLSRDKQGIFSFASLQSKTGQHIQRTHQLDPSQLDSMVLVKDGKAYTQSNAALKTAASLGGSYKLANLFLIIPSFIRNSVYNFIARNRYRWYGKSEACWMPRPEWKERFLD